MTMMHMWKHTWGWIIHAYTGHDRGAEQWVCEGPVGATRHKRKFATMVTKAGMTQQASRTFPEGVKMVRFQDWIIRLNYLFRWHPRPEGGDGWNTCRGSAWCRIPQLLPFQPDNNQPGVFSPCHLQSIVLFSWTHNNFNDSSPFWQAGKPSVWSLCSHHE